MIRYFYFLAILFLLTGCDCIQRASGVVLEQGSGKYLANVVVGKVEKEDTNHLYSTTTLTDTFGRFEYHRISGGLGRCPDLFMYFSKPGYRTFRVTFESSSQNDTVWLEPAYFRREVRVDIWRRDFDELVDECIALLRSKPLKKITDDQHINIMRCRNTIMFWDADKKVGRYLELEKISGEKNYDRDIISVYPKWIPNRGMGFYFPDLQMELAGTPGGYSIFKIKD
jgi:hypothetical protein